ncbi:unnamed protein product [Cuscuta campestris]|uniref:Retrotransposon gag domain-containing protein n=1 Tax=Cuscuta campestris TaxID=132261 RepID=A0A484MDR1_9ASTE|nr:unnamed protein product [Cuscuta campestris]
MSNPSRSMSHEELVAANTALQAQMEYLAKEVAKLTKQKMSMLQDSEDEEEASSSNTMRARAHEKSHSDFKVDIPIFVGKNDPDEFLEWLETVERVFDFKEVSDDKKVKIVALKFRKYASTWWTNTCTKRIRSEKPPVDSWQKMRSLLKKKFLPTEYSRENFAKLQTLRQGTKSVEDYTREFEELLLMCDLQENEGQTFVWRSIEVGWSAPTMTNEDGELIQKPYERFSKKEKDATESNDQALNTIFGAVDRNQFRLISNCTEAKRAWDILLITHEGTTTVKTAKLQIVMSKIENLKMEDAESITNFHGRLMGNLETIELEMHEDLRRKRQHVILVEKEKQCVKDSAGTCCAFPTFHSVDGDSDSDVDPKEMLIIVRIIDQR